jgi:acyl carrier protein phosphodiesterase
MENVYIKKEELNEWLAKYFIGDLISIDDLLNKMEDMDCEIDNLKEKIEEMEEQLKEKTIEVPATSYYGVSERDFY